MKTGILIPVMGLSWMTINLLESIKATCDILQLKIYIIDNGSTSEEAEKLNKWIRNNWFSQGFKGEYEIVLSKKPLGFIKAVNTGMDMILKDKLEYFILMNNDTLVTEKWLSKILETLKEDNVALVGPMSTPPDWRELPMGKAMIKQKLKYSQVKNSLNGFSKQLARNLDGVTDEVDFLAFYCIGIKSEMVRKIGKLDPIFNVGLFDDDDYCYRVLQAKYKIILRKDTYVHHYHNSTFLEHYGQEKYMEFLNVNRKIFKEKHGFDAWDRLKKVDKKEQKKR